MKCIINKIILPAIAILTVLAAACSVGITKTLENGMEMGFQITGELVVMIANIIINMVVTGDSRDFVKPKRTRGQCCDMAYGRRGEPSPQSRPNIYCLMVRDGS